MAEMQSPRILFAPASGPEVGGGHVMRDLALAAALADQGAACGFAVADYGRGLIARFGPSGLGVFPRQDGPDAVLDPARAFGAQVVVLDDYGLDARHAAPLRAAGLKVVAIDDLADRPHACDLLVDPGHGRQAEDYAGKVPTGCALALGPAYALVRADVARLARGREPMVRPEVGRVFVSFGLSDVGGIAARGVKALRPLAPGARFDVALAGDAQSLPELQAMAAADTGLHVHRDARDVAALMGAADVAVGAGGSSTWERCALGLPTLAAIVADNQRDVIARLAADGMLLAADMAEAEFDAQLRARFRELLGLETRKRLAAASRTLCDGQGATRAAHAILGLLSPAHPRKGGDPAETP
jgi:UDP-2,4-diacetamido-2,4,6-trideoxy-beta-L-altropyranose hydrolase